MAPVRLPAGGGVPFVLPLVPPLPPPPVDAPLTGRAAVGSSVLAGEVGPAGGSFTATTWASTFAPGRTRCKPLMMTVSSPVTPFTTAIRVPALEPTDTVRASTTPSGLTT